MGAGRSGEKAISGTQNAVRAVALLLAYTALAVLGLEVAFIHGTVSPVWPAAGLAIGALTLWGLRQWPAIAAGALIANFAFAGNALGVAAGIAAGNTLEACLGAAVLRRFKVSGEVSRIRDGLVIVAVALLAPTPSVVAGVTSLGLGHELPWEQVFDVGLVWWVGNTMGELVVLPLVLAWFGDSASPYHVARPAEFSASLLATVSVVWLNFHYSDALARIGLIVPPMTAILFPPVLWAVLRFRPRDALVLLAVGCTTAIFLTAGRSGAELIGPLLGLQSILFSLCAGTLVILGAITQRITTQVALSRSEQRLSEAVGRLNVILHHAPLGIAAVSLPDRRFLWVNDGLCAITGYTRDELLQKTKLDITFPEDLSIGQTEYERLAAHEIESFKMEKRYVRKDGSTIWARTAIASVTHAGSSEATIVIGIVEDVTEAHRTEEARRDAERRLQLAVDIAELGLW